MDLPIEDFMGKKNNNIIIRTLFNENNQKIIIKISNCVFILEDNYNHSTDKITHVSFKNNNITYNQNSFENLKDFVVKFIEYQKSKGWKYDLSYKSINHGDSSYNQRQPLSYYKDEYIITFTK